MAHLTTLPDFFLGYVVVVAVLVAAVLARYLPRRGASFAICILATWLGYDAILGLTGVVAKSGLPVPGIVILVLPAMTFIAAVFARSPIGLRMALRLPLSLLIGLQMFRGGVEGTLHRLWQLGAVPRLLTLSGGNVEIMIAMSAPFAAWVATRGEGGRRLAFMWNLAGLASLFNVAVRAVLTAPGPLNLLHTDPLNTALGTFPFTFIPGFMAPLGVILHILTWRALRAGRTSAEVGDSALASFRPSTGAPMEITIDQQG